MKLLVLTNMYPKKDALYRNAFIHRRVLSYKAKKHDIDVFVLEKKKELITEYNFENVRVIEGNKKALKSYIENEKPNKVLAHFINRHMIDVLSKFNKLPIIVWVHGVEALGWYRRLFNFIDLKFLRYILINTMQMYSLRKFIKKKKDVSFVFVSNWMKSITEKDAFIKLQNYSIIPNVIETNLFFSEIKDESLRKKILLIRPFESRKYANDIACKAILYLSKKDFFNELEFSIYGKGRYFESLTEPLRKFKNIKIYNKYLTHEEIAMVHKENGIFLCPTRQDSQGVSMCEAMSSGLVPISSNNTAIPEFVENKVSGFTTDGFKEIAECIEYMYFNPDKFIHMSKTASKSIYEMCRPELVIDKELSIISNGVKGV